MNQVYKIVWKAPLGKYVVVPEIAKSKTANKGVLFGNKKEVTRILMIGVLTATQLISQAMAFTPTVTNEIVNNEAVSGGSQEVITGGVANNTTVNNGGNQIVKEGGVTNTTTLSNNGGQTVGNNGTANGTIINEGGWQWILNGGLTENAKINSDGEQIVFDGGTANLTTIEADGNQTIHSGGIAKNTTIFSGGEQFIDNGGVADTTMINGGKQALFGIANNTIVSNGGLQTVNILGVANGTTLNTGGHQSVNDGGIANNTIVNEGGWQLIQSGGIAKDTTVNADGEQTIFNNGTANGTIINLDGIQTVHNGGTANTTTINTGGEQFIDVGGAANSTLINGGRLVLFGSAHGTIANAGEIYAGSGSVFNGATLINGTATIGGDLINNVGTLVFTPSTQNTVSTEITGTGNLIKAGAGDLILNNTHTYTGGTTVSGGRLIVGDTVTESNARISGTVNVTNGGTLGGHGQIAGAVIVHDGGKINPGNSVGTLSVGDAHFMGGSIFEARVNPDGTNDKLVAKNTLGTGTVKIDNGSNLFLLGGAGIWNETTSYNLIDTDSGVTGKFTYVNSNLAFLTPLVDYSNPNQVNLTMQRNNTGFGEIGGNNNEQNTGSGIESLGPNYLIYQQIVSMNAEQAKKAYNNLSGEIHASVKSALLENSRYPRHAVLAHLNSPVTESSPQIGRNLWINTWAHDGYLKDDGNAARLDNKGIGFIIGADIYQSATTTLGAAMGYEQSSLKVGDLRNSEADTKAIHLTAYGKTELGPIELKGGIDYSWFNIDSKRHVVVGDIFSQNSAKYHAGLFQIFTEGSHTFNINEQVKVAPYARLLYQNLSVKGFTEKGSNFQLHGNSSSEHVFSTTLGVRGEWKIGTQSNLYANLGWQHRFGDRDNEARLNFIGGSSYNLKGVQMDRDSLLIGLGANFTLQQNMSLNVGYDGQLGKRSKSHSLKINYEYRF